MHPRSGVPLRTAGARRGDPRAARRPSAVRGPRRDPAPSRSETRAPPIRRSVPRPPQRPRRSRRSWPSGSRASGWRGRRAAASVTRARTRCCTFALRSHRRSPLERARPRDDVASEGRHGREPRHDRYPNPIASGRTGKRRRLNAPSGRANPRAMAATPRIEARVQSTDECRCRCGTEPVTRRPLAIRGPPPRPRGIARERPPGRARSPAARRWSPLP